MPGKRSFIIQSSVLYVFSSLGSRGRSKIVAENVLIRRVRQ
jgi:hypothetical protein